MSTDPYSPEVRALFGDPQHAGPAVAAFGPGIHGGGVFVVEGFHGVGVAGAVGVAEAACV